MIIFRQVNFPSDKTQLVGASLELSIIDWILWSFWRLVSTVWLFNFFMFHLTREDLSLNSTSTLTIPQKVSTPCFIVSYESQCQLQLIHFKPHDCPKTYFLCFDFIFELRHSTRVSGEFVDLLLVFKCDVHIFNRLQERERDKLNLWGWR